jgi:hypothetical protein
MHYYGRTPVFFAARTPHIEDIGTLQSIAQTAQKRIEMKNLITSVALEFAEREAENAGALGLEPATSFTLAR